MKALPHLFAKLYASPLLLHEPARRSFEQHLLAHMGAGGTITEPAAQSGRLDMQRARIDSLYEQAGNIAVIRFHGVVDKMISQFEMDCYGGLDLADVDAALARAQNDPAINTVVLDIHSPGGSVTGTPETAARVATLRETKEVHAYTATLCASAAYYIASQADFIVAAPSALVGSIGVYMAVLDESRALELEGIKVEFIKGGRLKGMGASFKALTDEERDLMQAEVDRIWGDFKAAVTTLRDIEDEDMQGQVFSGMEAERRGLVDAATALSLDEYVSALLLR